MDNKIYLIDTALGAINILLEKEFSKDITNCLLDAKARLMIARINTILEA